MVYNSPGSLYSKLTLLKADVTTTLNTDTIHVNNSHTVSDVMLTSYIQLQNDIVGNVSVFPLKHLHRGSKDNLCL